MLLVLILMTMLCPPVDGFSNVLSMSVSLICLLNCSLTSVQIPRHHSNFVWAEYKLLAELEEGCFWYWRAQGSVHGTSMNHIAMRHRENHEKYFRVKSAKDAAQWTRVMTIPRSVARSHSNK
jgi:hypothetical protein